MLKLFKKIIKISEDVPQIITAQSVLVVNGEDVYITNDIIKVTTYDGETYVGRLDHVRHDALCPYIRLDISAYLHESTKFINIEDIKSVEPVEEEE